MAFPATTPIFSCALMQNAVFRHIYSMRQYLLKACFYLREWFFPFGCSLCGKALISGTESWYGLCDDCRTAIERDLAESRAGITCDCCGKPLISEHGRCLSCRNGEERAFDRVTVLFPYTGKYRQLLAAYKFRKNLALGNFFAEKIRQTLELGVLPEGALVPVPPRRGKIRKNGWDQVEYLAALLEKQGINRPIKRCLKRLPSKSQKELGRENRQSNLKGRIVPVRALPGAAIVIDDVMTTGATLDACAEALKKAGTQSVYGLCLFCD